MSDAYRIEVQGAVQGVGFRPFVWRLARDRQLGGWVRNAGGGVEIHVEGDQGAIDGFVQALVRDPPVHSRIDAIDVQPTGIDVRSVLGTETSGFEIRRSVVSAGRRLVPPDSATCADCRRELFDPIDRRFRYPFLNCTACGPRYTIIEDLPYDRHRTSMAGFELCEACRHEYEDPTDRRYHAEPVACPACGPRLSLVIGAVEQPGDPLARAEGLLAAGRIVAVKALGGYQLVCDATDDQAVSRLRQRKARPDKPFAVMVADLGAACDWFRPSADDLVLLASAAAPIVLIADEGRLAPSVAPGHRRQGVLLPATPLHHLLACDADTPLVLTSGNRSDEPIAIDDGEARAQLGDVADAFLVHDRAIVSRYDDSVASLRDGAPAVLRRARGYAPEPLDLPASVAPTLAVGAELSSSFCLATGFDAHVSQHLGDLQDDATLAAFRQALERLRRLTGIEPEMVAHDGHPDFLSTRLAQSLGLPTVPVQHHHAHAVSVMAERGWPGPVLGVVFDGFGLGEDGTAWGGEFLRCEWDRAERLGHLRAVPLVGGDAAVARPGRMLVAHAHDAGCLDEALSLLPGAAVGSGSIAALGARPADLVAQIEAGINAVPTTSAGRLFDAVAAAVGVCTSVTYDGQPAVLLEQVAGVGARSAQDPADTWPVVLDVDGGPVVVDTRPMVRGVVGDLRGGRPRSEVAVAVHRWLADAVVATVRVLRERTASEGIPLDRVVLAGGAFANDLLLNAVLTGLRDDGAEVAFARRVPPGDGGIALGQTLVAHARSTDLVGSGG